MLGCPAVLLFLSRSACLQVAAGMICPAKGRDALPAYQHRANGSIMVTHSSSYARATI